MPGDRNTSKPILGRLRPGRSSSTQPASTQPASAHPAGTDGAVTDVVPNAPKPWKRPDPAKQLLKYIGHAIPAEPTTQFTALSLLERNVAHVPNNGGKMQVLDFGAGSGDRLPELREVIPSFSYTGIDLKMPNTSRHTGEDVRFVAYDGKHMPFDDATFDLCFCKQVLEHVRYPDQAISEIARVLRPGGVFAGSVSFLEPYHAQSIFNWTPYGLATLLGDHGFGSIELRPGIDGAALALRTLFGPPAFGKSFTAEAGSAFNHHIEMEGRHEGPQLRNARKLVLTGHLCFFASKA